jgi:hypothetical protein
VDADTGKPIDGVVVLGVWNKEYPTAAGGVTKFYDAMEIVTDKNGEFEISGQGLRILSFLEPVKILIFKAGYEYVSGSWDSLKESYLYKEKIKWEGNKAIISLKKLTAEERLRRGDPPFIAPAEKMKLMLQEFSKNRVERGLEPY